MKTNSGTASRVKLVSTPQIRSGSSEKKSKPSAMDPNNIATAPNVNATGYPSNSAAMATANMTKPQISIGLRRGALASAGP